MKSDLNSNDSVNLSIPESSEIAIRTLREIMERPFAALGKKKRFKPIEYKTGNVEVLITSPQPWGIATIYDMDIMMWIASRITEARDRGDKTSPIINFTPYDCLTSIGRGTSGREYQKFEEAINRLFNTRIITTIRAEDQYRIKGKKYSRKITRGFHWLEEFEILTESTKTGKEIVRGVKVILPMWFYLGIVKHNSVLQLASEYFKLKSGLERALYLIARKHCGRQNWWYAPMKLLYQKTGSDQRFSDFARDIRKAVERNILPEYVMKIEKKKDTKEEIVHFYYRNKLNVKNKYWEPKRIKGKLTSGNVEKSLADQ